MEDIFTAQREQKGLDLLLKNRAPRLTSILDWRAENRRQMTIDHVIRDFIESQQEATAIKAPKFR